jgi:hypothetical protein
VGLQLGAVSGKEYSLGGVDLDSCRDPATGAIAPWAIAIISAIGSYAEISPSGTGVKIFFLYPSAVTALLRRMMGTEYGKCFKRGQRIHPPAIELHIGNRYFAVTDMHLAETPAEFRLVALEALAWVLQQAGPAFVRDGVSEPLLQNIPPVVEAPGHNAVDDPGGSSRASDQGALLARLQTAMQSRPLLAARWTGSTAGLRDASRSGLDMSMTRLLKESGFSSHDTKDLLLHWNYGAGAEHASDERYFTRMWDRCGTANPKEQSAEAQHSGESAEPTELWPEPVDFFATDDMTGTPELREDHLPAALHEFVNGHRIENGSGPG